MSEKMFETASRLGLTFESTRGNLTVTDLWSLPLTSRNGHSSLDSIAIALNKKVKEAGETESFVTETTTTDEVLLLKFEIVKRIIGVLKAERDEAAKAAKAREQKQQILALIAQKENEQLAGTSLEDLRKMAEAL